MRKKERIHEKETQAEIDHGREPEITLPMVPPSASRPTIPQQVIEREGRSNR
jgi:hypothetical protein